MKLKIRFGRLTFSKQPPPIHYVHSARLWNEKLEAYTACGANAPSSQLTSRPSDVTCPACLAGMEAAGGGILTYQLGYDEELRANWIKCLGCGLTSYLAQDIFHRYCGHCHVFHDDLWPPARKWWIENTPKVVDAKGRRIPGAERP